MDVLANSVADTPSGSAQPNKALVGGVAGGAVAVAAAVALVAFLAVRRRRQAAQGKQHGGADWEQGEVMPAAGAATRAGPGQQQVALDMGSGQFDVQGAQAAALGAGGGQPPAGGVMPGGSPLVQLPAAVPAGAAPPVRVGEAAVVWGGSRLA